MGSLESINEENALTWLMLSAAGNNADAMYCLGTLMLTPNSGIYNREEGLLQLRNAEKNGQEEAALYLMIIDVYDTDCIDDLVNISQVAHDGPAADLGTLILRLGNSLYQSEDLPNHKLMALRAYGYASKYGNIDAMMKAGYMLEHGEEVKQSFEAALKFYQKAADLGDPMAKELLQDLMERMDSDYIIIDDP